MGNVRRMNICKTIIPPRKQQPCLAQSVEKSVAGLNQQLNVPQVPLTENLAAGQRKIPLTRGQFAIIDEEDYARISKHKWCCHKMGMVSKRFYASRSEKYTVNKSRPTILMHREILGLYMGREPQVDHINGNSLDNRKCNLRIMTQVENSMAKRIRSPRYLSKYRGVTLQRRSGKWIARAGGNGVKKHIGVYESEIEAAKAYNKRAIELGFYPEALNKFD